MIIRTSVAFNTRPSNMDSLVPYYSDSDSSPELCSEDHDQPPTKSARLEELITASSPPLVLSSSDGESDDPSLERRQTNSSADEGLPRSQRNTTTAMRNCQLLFKKHRQSKGLRHQIHRTTWRDADFSQGRRKVLHPRSEPRTTNATSEEFNILKGTGANAR